MGAINQCIGYFLPGGIGAVQNTPMTVASLLSEVVAIVARLVTAGEVNALGNKPAQRIGAIFSGELHGIVVAQASARTQGIFYMGFNSVFVAEHPGNAHPGPTL